MTTIKRIMRGNTYNREKKDECNHDIANLFDAQTTARRHKNGRKITQLVITLSFNAQRSEVYCAAAKLATSAAPRPGSRHLQQIGMP